MEYKDVFVTVFMSEVKNETSKQFTHQQQGTEFVICFLHFKPFEI